MTAGAGGRDVAQAVEEGAALLAEDGLDALFAGRDSVVAGALRNRVQAEAGTHLPDKFASALMGRMTKPGSA